MPPATIATVKRIEAIYFMKDWVLEFIVMIIMIKLIMEENYKELPFFLQAIKRSDIHFI